MIYILFGVIALILDQVTKHFAIVNLKGTNSIEVIKDYLYFTYLENRGAAFGFLNQFPIIFTILASLFVIFMSIYLLKNYNKIDRIYKLGFIMMIVGALGNLIDRIRFGFVVDFIFSPLGGLYDFPVFNLADVYLTLTAILLFIYAFLFDKDNKSENVK